MTNNSVLIHLIAWYIVLSAVALAGFVFEPFGRMLMALLRIAYQLLTIFF